MTPRPSLVNLHRSEEHTSELQSCPHLVCRLLLEKKKKKTTNMTTQTRMTHNSKYTNLITRPHTNHCSYLLTLPHKLPSFFIFFFNATATTEIYTLSLHDALPISTKELGPARGALKNDGHADSTGRA